MKAELQAQYKKNNLFLILCAIFLTNAIVAEIVGAKLFSLEATLGLSPAKIFVFGQGPLDFTLTCGVILWPVVFVTTDIINEYFGKKGVKKASLMTAFIISYVFVVIWLVTGLPPSPVWLSSYPELQINEAFTVIFRQGLGIIIGSLAAFLLGQFTDVITFHWLRKLTGSGKIWLRATGSTLVSQLVDSFVVLFIAFYIFGRLDLKTVLAIGTVNYMYKFVVAVALTPVLYIAHGIIDNYLGKEQAETITEEAAASKLF